MGQTTGLEHTEGLEYNFGWLGCGRQVGKPKLDVKPVTLVESEGSQGAEVTLITGTISLAGAV